ALYVISGGILMRGDLLATPLVNSAFLATGSVLASFIGTTGASMLLIRALLQTNRERTRDRHTVIFFIFLVSNIGGMLTPLGDPPRPGADRAAPGARRAEHPRPCRRGARGRLSRRARPRSRHGGAGGRLALVDAPRDPPRKRLHLLPDRGGRGPLLRHLPHDDPRARALATPGWRARRARALAVLLGDRRALVLSRQRPDLPDVPRAGSGPGPRAGGGGRSPRAPD